jgi:hypothetical protein
MDSGRLLVFLGAETQWEQLLADLQASGAECLRVKKLEAVFKRLKKESFDAVLVPQAVHDAHPELQELSCPILLAEELSESPESELIDPFAQLGDRSVLRTLDRHLDRVEELLKTLEDRL